MKADATRGIAITLNLALAGFLAYLWISLVGTTHNEVSDLASWIMMISLVFASVTSTGATALLARRRTLVAGLRWHDAVGWSWIGFLIACIVGFTSQHNGGSASDWLVLGVIAALGSLWPALGFALRHCLKQDAGQPVTSIVTPIVTPQPIQTTPNITTLSSVPVTQEAAPLVIARRG